MSETMEEFEELREEAARRVARAHMTGVAPEHDVTLAAWRREDPANEAAFHAIHAIWEKAKRLPAHPDYTALMGPPTLRERWIGWRDDVGESAIFVFPRRWAATAAIAMLLAAIGIGSLLTPGRPDYRTEIAEVKELPLEDGSIVTLGAKSAMDVAFSDTERRVKLASGEAFFAVAKNSARPFIVEAGDTLIRVTGTKFNVNYEGGRVRVSVLEGHVEVRRRDTVHVISARDATQEPVVLTAGEQAVDAENQPSPHLERTKLTDIGTWREGRLSYQDAALADVIADANRYRAGKIRFASGALAQARITTSFKVSQIDQMIEMLPDIAPVRVMRGADGTVELMPAADGR